MARLTALRKLAPLALLACSTLPASTWNKLTHLKVHEPIAIPGAVLQPGEYVVKLVDSPSNRHIVRFLNGDQNEVIATVLAVPNRRMRPSGETELGFYETPAGEPVALRSWFYPGDTFGQEFVYPEKQARRIAGQTKRHVPAADDAIEGTIREKRVSPEAAPAPAFETVRIYAVDPAGARGEYEKGFDANAILDGNRPRQARTSRRYAEFARERSRVAPSDRAVQGISREVRHELVMLPRYGVFDHLAFTVIGSTVNLMGEVTLPTTKSAAERVVKNIEGVEHVRNNIKVLPASPADDRIRAAMYGAIYGHTALSRYALRAVPPIHIIVNNGHVTLEGVVANEGDKNIAAMQARSVPGVFSVTNNLTVEHGGGGA
jgi:hyperosmotically inducible protein